MSQYGQQRSTQHRIEKYNLKVGAGAAGSMGKRFDPKLNFASLALSFNLSILLNIVIDVNITFPVMISPMTRAQYGYAKYGIDKYDPFTAFAILIPDTLQKSLFEYMVRHFLMSGERGYKYDLATSYKFVDATENMLTKFAPEPVWKPRFQKIEAWRNWGSFWGAAFWGVNIWPQKYILIRITGHEKDYGWPDNPNTVRTGEDLAPRYGRDLYGATFYRLPIKYQTAPYPEYFVKTLHLYVYQPVWGVANWGYDVWLDKPFFDPSILFGVVQDFRNRQQPQYRELTWFTGSERMKALHSIHASYQGDVFQKIQRLTAQRIRSPLEIPQYYAFALEYAYTRKFEQLVNGEAIIQKYKALGLNESLLRDISFLTLR
jgi:hypothetical protein